MGNIGATLKRFLANKNTVTILGVILGIIVLFIGYNYRINKAVDTIMVPYAKKTIASTKEITSDVVGTMEILRSTVNNNKTLISDINRVVSTSQRYCVAEKTSVPEGGFFYTEQVKLCDDVASNVFDRMPDGYLPVAIPVDLQTTYGNSMIPGEYIDIWARMTSDTGLLIYSRLISKLPIMDVRDANGNSIYYGGNGGVPAMLLFGVPEADGLFDLLAKAVILPDNIVELVPMPRNANYSAEAGETKVTNEQLKEEILRYTINIGEEDIPDWS